MPNSADDERLVYCPIITQDDEKRVIICNIDSFTRCHIPVSLEDA